jgi:hypothetical protein
LITSFVRRKGGAYPAQQQVSRVDVKQTIISSIF